MRRSAHLNACALLCAAVCAAAPSRAAAAAAAAEPAWRLVATRSYDHPVTYAGFLDERSGVTVGVHGRVHYTTDGGETWPQARNLSDCRSALELLPDGFAWHAGTLEVNRSFNGGRTWYPVASFHSGIDYTRSLSFADENRGLIATDRRLGATEDGGLHWSELALPAGAAEIAAVSLALSPPPAGDREPTVVRLHERRPVIARVLDAAGALWTSADGGASFRREPTPLADAAFHVAARAPTVALRFTSAGEGVLAAFVREGDGAGLRFRIWRRPPRGAAWVEEPAPDLAPDGLGTLFLSPDGRVLTWRSFDRDELRIFAHGPRGDAP